KPAIATKPHARTPPPASCLPRNAPPPWPLKQSRFLAATATLTTTRPVACGATPNCTRSVAAPRKSAVCLSAASCSAKPRPDIQLIRKHGDDHYLPDQ